MDIAEAVDSLPNAATCSICWRIFKEPVTLNCGHNYCRNCISCYWDGSRVSCPQCKETYVCKTFQLNEQLGTIAKQLQQLRMQRVVFVTREEKFGLCKDHKQPLLLFCKDDGVFVCSVCEASELHGDHFVAPMEIISKDYKHEIKVLLELQKHMRTDIRIFCEDLRMEKQNVVRILDEGVEKVSRDYKELLELVRKVQAEQVTLAKEIEKEIDAELYKFHKKRQELKKVQNELEKKLELDPYELLKDIKETMSKGRSESFHKLECALPETKDKLWELSRRYLFIQNTLRSCHDTLLLKPKVEKAMVTLNPLTAYPLLLISEDLKTVTYDRLYYNLMTDPLGFDTVPCVLGSEGFTAGRHCWEVEIATEEDEGWALGIAKESVRRKGNIALEEGEGIWALQPKSSSQLWKAKPVRIHVILHYEEGQLEFFDASSKELITAFRAMWLDGEKVFPFFMLGTHYASMRLCF